MSSIALTNVQGQQYSQAKAKVFFFFFFFAGSFYWFQMILWREGMEPTWDGWVHPHTQNMAGISRTVQERMHPSRDVATLNLVPGGGQRELRTSRSQRAGGWGERKETSAEALASPASLGGRSPLSGHGPGWCQGLLPQPPVAAGHMTP